ncbi:MAG: hypothetical protein ACREDS_02265 [Limisphaerales bacterium]
MNPMRPRWNVTAVIMQGVALLAGFTALTIFGKPEGLVGLIYAVPTYAFFSLLGTITACIALVRQERWWMLSWFSLLINCIPFIWMFSIIAQKVNF